MPMNMLDVGKAYGDAERIKTMRNRNALADFAMEKETGFNALAPQIAQGDEAARMSAMAIDPERTASAWDAYGKEDNARRVQVARLAKFVLDQPPENRPAAWQQARGAATKIPGIDMNNVPEEYDEQALQMIYAGATDPKALKGQSPIGKLEMDRRAGILTPEQTAAGVAKANAPKGPVVEVNMGQSGVDYGNPPKGHAWARDKAGKVLTQTNEDGYETPIAVPVAGGPVEAKRLEAEEADIIKKQTKRTQADIVTEDIDRAVSMVENAKFPVTGMGAFLSAVPGTPAHDLAAKLDTIKANIGFDKLQAMREASKTGGALGQVSEFENRMLQATMGSLLQSQTKDEFMFNLRRMKETYLDIIHGPGNRPGQGGKKGGDFTEMSDEEFKEMPLTDDNATAWMEEAIRRGLTQ